MSLQLNIFLLLFGGLQGLLVSLFLIRKKLYLNGYLFLLLYFGVMLLQITLKVMSKAWLFEHWHYLYSMSYLLPLLYGPLVFLFARRFLLNKKAHISDLLHFFPFAFGCFYFTIGAPYNKLIYLIYGAQSGVSMQLLSLVVYHALALRYWYLRRDSLKEYFSEMQQLQMKWIRQFIIGSFIACTIIALAIYFLFINYPGGHEFRYGFATLTIFIYWVSYSALMQPSVFSIIKGGQAKQEDTTHHLPKWVIHRPAKKYYNSGISQENMTAMRTELQKLMAEQKPYLKPDLTINDLAALIKCNRHHLSQVLNESMQQSFYDYVNHLRVEEARQLLLDPARETHKIAAIAYDAGFNSLSTFNDVFKKMTGMTPTQFRKDIQQVSKQRRG